MPDSLIGIAIFVLAVSPGYVFIRIAETRTTRPPRSSLLELADLVVIGVSATAVAIGIVLVAARFTADDLLLNLDAWAEGASTYVLGNPARSLRTGVLVLALSWCVAALAGLAVHRGSARLSPGRTVYQSVLGVGGDDNDVFVSAHLADGTVVEGYAWSYPVGLEDVREIALQAPLFAIDAKGERTPIETSGFVVLSMERVLRLGVRLDPRLPPDDSSRSTRMKQAFTEAWQTTKQAWAKP